MDLNDLLIEAQIDMLLEAPLDIPEGTDLISQIEIIGTRLGAAKQALGITNKLKDPADRKRHRGRVMTFMNQLRGMFERLMKQMWEEYETEEKQGNPFQSVEPIGTQQGNAIAEPRMAA